MSVMAMASFDSLPNELVLKIVKMSTEEPIDLFGRKYDHDFLVDILCKVSSRFKQMATDSSLWTGSVKIWMDDGEAWVGKARFVVKECVNIGTREITMAKCGRKFKKISLSTKVALERRFPDLNWVQVRSGPFGSVKFCRENDDNGKRPKIINQPVCYYQACHCTRRTCNSRIVLKHSHQG